MNVTCPRGLCGRARRKLSDPTHDTDDWLTHKTDRVLVQKLGPRDWGKIAAQLVNRNGKQCHQRWNYFLSPNVLKSAWSQEEDQNIVCWQQAIGNKWAKIATYLPGRCVSVVSH